MLVQTAQRHPCRLDEPFCLWKRTICWFYLNIKNPFPILLHFVRVKCTSHTHVDSSGRCPSHVFWLFKTFCWKGGFFFLKRWFFFWSVFPRSYPTTCTPLYFLSSSTIIFHTSINLKYRYISDIFSSNNNGTGTLVWEILPLGVSWSLLLKQLLRGGIIMVVHPF